MRGQLIGDEAGFPGDRVVAVDAPVVSVDEINPLLGADGGARCEQEQGQAQRRYGFLLPVRCAVPHIPVLPKIVRAALHTDANPL